MKPPRNDDEPSPAPPLGGPLSLPPAARPSNTPGFFQRRAIPLEDLLADRLCWLPPETCAGCRHLGPPVYIRTPRGDRRTRRQCEHARTGYTAPDWPRCDSYQEQGPGVGGQGSGAVSLRDDLDAVDPDPSPLTPHPSELSAATGSVFTRAASDAPGSGEGE